MEASAQPSSPQIRGRGRDAAAPTLNSHIRAGACGRRHGLGLGVPQLIYPDDRIAAELLSGSRPRASGRSESTSRAATAPGAPRLIPLDCTPGDKPKANRFWLTATEDTVPYGGPQARGSLSENSWETGDLSYMVLSSEPFAIYRFTHRTLSDRGSEEDASVAIYLGDSRIWQYKRVSDYHYVLPPQSIGESAYKPGRLEIHDLPKTSTETPPPPAVDGLKRRAVEYRLTPSAEIWIRPSDVERGYFMPESSSYEIFCQSSELGLGAALAFLRAEFLYGLPVGIDVSKESSLARGARVAEIEALTAS